MSFSADISRIAQRQGRRLGDVARAIKIQLFTSVVVDTRVDTGRMRGNWQVSVGNPILVENDRLDVNGSMVINDINRTVTPDNIDYMANNVPYAAYWEQRDGMVSRNFARLDRILTEAAR